MNHFPDILRYLRYCLSVVVEEPHIVVMNQSEEEFDFASLQARDLHFKTGQYQEHEILRWPADVL